MTLLHHIAEKDHRGLPRVADLISSAKIGQLLNVLELGAGVGTAGIAFATMVPSAKVVITDVAEAERLVMMNVAANSMAKGSTVEFQTLDWEDELPAGIKKQAFDVVLVADCIYNEDSIPALVKTLAALATTSPKMVVLVATKTRHSSESLFFDLAAKENLANAARTTVLAPAGYAKEDLDEAERIDMYEFVVSST